MFEEIGHHVEKIKRVGYGPLTLDVEPGRFRELTPREVESLRRFNGKTRTRTIQHGEAERHRGTRRHLH
jgi:hypothetical protein